MGHARLGGVYAGTTEVFLRHVFARYGLNHLGAGEEHVGCALGHKREVGQGRRVHSATCAGAEDARDLRDDTRSQDVTLEDFRVSGQSVNAFLNTCATRVVDADAGCTHHHGLVHDLADLLRHGLGERAAEDGEVLRKDVHQASVDRTATGHYAVAKDLLLVLSEVRAAVLYEHVHLFEAAFVEQHIDALTGGVFTALVLLSDGLFAATQAGFLTLGDEFFYLFKLIAHFLLICLKGSHFIQSSVRTPCVDLGCRKAMWRPSAPGRGFLSISCTPFDAASSRAACTSGVAKAM